MKRLLLIVVSRFNPSSPTQGPALSPPDMALPTIVDLYTSQTSKPHSLMSLFPFLMDLQNSGSTEDLAVQDYGLFEIMSRDSLPTQYDKNVIFEIPPEEATTRKDFRHYNGHA